MWLFINVGDLATSHWNSPLRLVLIKDIEGSSEKGNKIKILKNKVEVSSDGINLFIILKLQCLPLTGVSILV